MIRFVVLYSVQAIEEPERILETLFSLENPALYAFLTLIVFVVLIMLIKQDYIKPLTSEKEKLELQNARLTALFAEVDPDPILRINSDGIIIDANNAAKNIFKGTKLSGNNIMAICPFYNDVENKESFDNYSTKIGNSYFLIKARKVSYLDFTQIYFHDITEIKEAEMKVERDNENILKLRAKLNRSNEEEKQKIGRELHDSIGQSISLIKLELDDIIKKNCEKIKPAKFEKITLSIDALSDEVRDISHRLKPKILAEFGIRHAITSLIESINSKGEIKGFFNFTGNEDLIGKDLEFNIYRICQEALNNIIKHAGCSEFSIQLFVSKTNVKFIIFDNGKGFIEEDEITGEETSLGIFNMKERASEFEGTFSIDSIRDKGTTIFIIFPIG